MADDTNPSPSTGVARLTDEQIDKIFAKHFGGFVTLQDQRNAARAIESAVSNQPIGMVLHCPKCGMQHVDAPEAPYDMAGLSDDAKREWDNPPHRSHLCHGCGHIWRPADVPTNGVAAVKTAGKADSPIAALYGLAVVGVQPEAADLAEHMRHINHLILTWAASRFSPDDRRAAKTAVKESARRLAALASSPSPQIQSNPQDHLAQQEKSDTSGAETAAQGECPLMPSHPEHHSMTWTRLERECITEYGLRCFRTGRERAVARSIGAQGERGSGG